MAVELKKQAEERKEAEEAFYRNQELMMEAEKQRRDLILLEEQKLADQRVRLVLTITNNVSLWTFFIMMSNAENVMLDEI